MRRRYYNFLNSYCTPDFKSVVLLILRMRLKELEMQIDLGACANLNRTTDLKSGVFFQDLAILKTSCVNRMRAHTY